MKNKLYGQLIMNARKDARLSQKDLAEKAGLGLSSLRRYESGERIPRLSELENISTALNVDLVSLVQAQAASFEHAPAARTMLRMLELEILPSDPKWNLLGFYDMLNQTGQMVAIERTKELTEIPRYQKEKGGE